jgi:hypothetical protein
MYSAGPIKIRERVSLSKEDSLIPAERIEGSILLIRGQKVILDKDLATLYLVSTTDLNKAVSRNLTRFPEDFMFQLSREEFNNLKFQFGTSSWGGTRKLPRAFTEQGVAMLSGVLRSKRAAAVNIEIMRAFVRLRQMLASNVNLERRLNEQEQKYDAQFKVVFDAIRRLMAPAIEPKKNWIPIEGKTGRVWEKIGKAGEFPKGYNFHQRPLNCDREEKNGIRPGKS